MTSKQKNAWSKVYMLSLLDKSTSLNYITSAGKRHNSLLFSLVHSFHAHYQRLLQVIALIDTPSPREDPLTVKSPTVALVWHENLHSTVCPLIEKVGFLLKNHLSPSSCGEGNYWFLNKACDWRREEDGTIFCSVPKYRCCFYLGQLWSTCSLFLSLSLTLPPLISPSPPAWSSFIFVDF